MGAAAVCRYNKKGCSSAIVSISRMPRVLKKDLEADLKNALFNRETKKENEDLKNALFIS